MSQTHPELFARDGHWYARVELYDFPDSQLYLDERCLLTDLRHSTPP